METKGGKISRYVDFWNPLVGMQALGDDPADMVAAFSND